MLGKLIAAALLAGSASAHVALWDKGMFGYNYPYQADDPSNNNYNNDISVHPLRQADNLQTDQWFGHGYKGYPPKAGDFMELPSGGTYNGELGCNRADTTMRDPLRTDPLPQYACDGEGALHTVNRFNATVDPKWFGGSALAIAYTSDVASLQPNDLTVISVNHYSVWNRVTPYAIPSGMPPCPSGGCLCTWNWIHMANHGEGYGQEIYNNLYRCTVTGKTDSTKVVQKGSIPVDCSADSSKCVKGPKTPMYVYQASGNNMPNTDTPPTYTDGFGFFDGAQNDVFELAATPVSSGSTQPTATSLPTGWSSLGCYVDQDPRSLPVFFSSTTNNTIQSCVAGCASNGYIYAGVEGAECWCSGPNPTLVAATSGCNKPCGGDGWATCGGDWRLNVYKAANAPATITPTSTVVPTAYPTASLPAGWSAVGCLMDSATSRTLDRGMTQYSDLTVAKCIALAESKGLPYAGVQYGKECWLGDAASSENFVQADGCNVPCGGDSGTLCGGSYRLNAYVNNALISSSSAVATATTTSSLYIASSTSKSASTSPAASSTKLASTSPAATSTKPATSTTPPATKTAAISASSVSTSTSAPTLPSGWQALGCQGDSGGSSRMLKGVQINSNSMTPQMCMSLCSSRGYKYAGVEYGTQCFCGATVELAPRSSGCTSACGGDKSQMCGGAYRLNLYENTAVSKRALDGDEKAEKRRRDGHAGHGHGHARRNMLRFGRLGMDREGLGLH